MQTEVQADLDAGLAHNGIHELNKKHYDTPLGFLRQAPYILQQSMAPMTAEYKAAGLPDDDTGIQRNLAQNLLMINHGEEA